MNHKNGDDRYHTLSSTQELLAGVEDTADAFSLEDILAEYGKNGDAGEHKKKESPVRETAPMKEPAEVTRQPKEAVAEEQREASLTQETRVVEPVAVEMQEESNEESAPRMEFPWRRKEKKNGGVTIEDMVARTVDQVQEEYEEDEPEEEAPRDRSLFSRRRKAQETEQLYEEPERAQDAHEADETFDEVEELEEEEIEEPPLEEAYMAYHRLSKAQRSRFLPVLVLTLLQLALLVAEHFGVEIPVWSSSVVLQSVTFLVLHALVCAFSVGVFADAARAVRSRRCPAAVLVALTNIAALLDCAARPFLAGRCEAEPLNAVASIVMCFAVWGRAAHSRGVSVGFRVACMGEPAYTVVSTADGACKSRGDLTGFYRNTVAEDPTVRWQTVILPLVIAASFVFAALASIGQGQSGNLLWCWSAVLTTATTFALPVSYSLPYIRFANRLYKSGSAVSGYKGAKELSHNRRMVVSDMDLFPPGTVQLNGIKVFGEEISKVVSYAASLAKASNSGLDRIFENLLQREGGRLMPLENLEFCGEGGVSASIRGETAVLGSASCMRKMGVRLPGGLTLKTGVFLAVDGQLTAIFAAKYLTSENVDWALHAMRRNRIVPVLATRDGNITPALLKRKFSTDAHAVYPPLSERVALSQVHEENVPGADGILFREGLMPFAEVVTGSGRFCRAVRTANIITLLGSVVGVLLGYYLTFSGALHVLTPLTLTIYLALWSLPTFLAAGWVDHY